MVFDIVARAYARVASALFEGGSNRLTCRDGSEGKAPRSCRAECAHEAQMAFNQLTASCDVRERLLAETSSKIV